MRCCLVRNALFTSRSSPGTSGRGPLVTQEPPQLPPPPPQFPGSFHEAGSEGDSGWAHCNVPFQGFPSPWAALALPESDFANRSHTHPTRSQPIREIKSSFCFENDWRHSAYRSVFLLLTFGQAAHCRKRKCCYITVSSGESMFKWSCLDV